MQVVDNIFGKLPNKNVLQNGQNYIEEYITKGLSSFFSDINSPNNKKANYSYPFELGHIYDFNKERLV